MTTYKVVSKTQNGIQNGSSCNCIEGPPQPSPCWHQPPSCARYPAVISLPNDLVDPNCQLASTSCCGDNSLCPQSYWGLPYWWTPWWMP